VKVQAVAVPEAATPEAAAEASRLVPRVEQVGGRLGPEDGVPGEPQTRQRRQVSISPPPAAECALSPSLREQF